MSGVRMLLAVVVALLLPGAAAADVTKTELRFDVLVGADRDIPCVVDASLWTPEGASAEQRVPAILMTHGFAGEKTDLDRLGRAYSERGYAVLAYSGLGFGASGCKITLDDREHDGLAGSQLVSFLAGTKAAQDGSTIDFVVKDAPGDPRVGMVGGSYGGQIQFAVAGVDERVDTIVPTITWNELGYALAPNNAGPAPGVVKLDWPVLLFGAGVGTTIQQVLLDPSRQGSCPNFADTVCPALLGGAVGGYLPAEGEALLHNASVASYISAIKIPTFLIQGQSDILFNLQESVRTYAALRAQGTPVKLLWRSAGHSGGGLGRIEFNATDLETAYESRLVLQWLDHWLKREGEQPPLDFAFLTDWLPHGGTDAAAAVGVAPQYPAGTTQRLLLSGFDALVADAPQAGQAGMLSVPVAPTSQGGGVAGSNGFDPPGTSVSYTTPALDEPLDIAGIPHATFRVHAPTFISARDPASRLVLFGKLYDVAPEGSAQLIRNQVSAARIADPTQPVTLELPGLVHRFRSGHRLRLTISTSAASFRSSIGAGPVSVLTDAANPGVLELPRLGPPSGPVGSAPNGLTPFGGSRVTPADRVRRVRCRAIRIRLRGARRVKVARIWVNGRLVKAVRGKRLRRAIIVRVPRTGARVVVVSRTKSGAKRRAVRRFGRCAR